MKFIFFLLFPSFCFSQANQNKITFLDDKVEIVVPTDLAKMTREVLALKYPGRKEPTLALSDENGEINLIGEYTQQQVTNSQIKAYTNFTMVSLKKNHPDLKVINTGIKTVNGKQIGFFKFISKAIDQNIFNYYFITIVDGKALVFTFNCIDRLRSTWEKNADGIVASLKVR
ncbi:MAG: hypothetical protein JWN83_1333 [Chitinophagaceae bacterium]|nr:hypothetical protein [Chitinophagaceae bacterium]